ncbi:MAG: hypothetical protein ACK54L_21970, partial [Betaproteobacteria bacterium]
MNHRTVSEAGCAIAGTAQPQQEIAGLPVQRQRLVRKTHPPKRRSKVAQDPRQKPVVATRRRQALVQTDRPLKALDRLRVRAHHRLGNAQGRQMMRFKIDAPDRLCDADGTVQRNGGFHL